jgi:hypothetical protein
VHRTGQKRLALGKKSVLGVWMEKNDRWQIIAGSVANG